MFLSNKYLKKDFFSNNNINIKKIIENEIMLGNEISIIYFLLHLVQISMVRVGLT